MRNGEFGYWTRAGSRKRAKFTRKRRGYLALFGMALLVFGIGFSFLELREPGSGGESSTGSSALRLTVPELERVRGMPVETASSGDEGALRRGPVRLAGTGLPSQTEPNVYISGHRLGYPGTDSFLMFRDLNQLGDGDEVVLRDGEGRRYMYRVFDREVVGPGEFSVTEPVEGRNVVSLQTCTLPDYTQRLVVRAELVQTTRS